MGAMLKRRQLGRHLRRLRLDSGKTVNAILRAKIMGKSKLYDIEGGKQPELSWPEIQELARLYGAPEDLVAELVRMARESLEPGWWEPFTTSMVKDFALLLELEQVSDRIFIYASELVPGWFQSLDYMRSIDGITDEAVKLREQRQVRFWARDPAPGIIVVLNEAVLRRGMTPGQRERLRSEAERPNVDVRVLPFDAGMHASMDSSYMILDFPDEEDPDVVYLESRDGIRFEEGPATVAHFRRTFSATRQLSILMEE
ncbi:helix-turn-helix domain-containing protein [Glycomyces sp. MUSA5-2]|uniref:helix-turn-helix domain-containing protein n=1 Tax=Glycomyces sp. MUSA5-2 TaxID=2053002 RepID=UPI0030092C51